MYCGQQCVYQNDSYLHSVTTKILECTDNSFRCDKVVLYPTGGGQLNDTGWAKEISSKEEYSISNCIRNSDGIWYECFNHPFKANTTINTNIDIERRNNHMLLHTTLHILCSVCPFPVTGCKINGKKASIDFNLGDSSLASKDELNEEIQKIARLDYSVKILLLYRNEIEGNEDLSDFKYIAAKLPDSVGNNLRLISIGDNYNSQLCGGTHVSSTSLTDAIRVSKIENKGRKNRRVIIQIQD